MPHDTTKTRPERRKAPAGSTVRVDGLHVSREAWARVVELAAQMARAGIPRAHRSGALDLLLIQPHVAAQVLAGGCRAYRCATCGTWPPGAREALQHQDEHPDHEVQGFSVPPTQARATNRAKQELSSSPCVLDERRVANGPR